MKMRLLALCMAVAGLMLASCGDNEKKVTGPATDGVVGLGDQQQPVTQQHPATPNIDLDALMAQIHSATPAAKALASPLWMASGPGTVALISDGTSADPEMSYALVGYGTTFSTQTWQFNTTATQTGPVTLNYQYSGYHAYYQVRVFLQAQVGGTPVATLVSAGPVNCCSSPSGGFNYSGSYTFNVTAGQTYGFRFGGSNFDSDARLLGTFKIPGFTPPPPVDNTPPVITLNGPAALTLECHVDTYTEQGATATDDTDGAGTVSVSGSVNANAEGDYTVTYSAADGSGNTATATRTVHVVDTTAPAITLNGSADLTLECHVDTYTEQGATANDLCDDPVAVSVSGSVNANAEGDYPITYSAVDGSGNTATAIRTVHVVDTTAPTLSLVVSPKSLWPPNHLMVEVGEIVAADLCDPSVSLNITVTSNEPQNGTGDGDTAPDWEIVDNGDGTASVSVRAERKGNGTGRIYTISVTATDEAGNNSSKTGTVTVAQSQGKKK